MVNGIQILRGIAATIVVFVHIQYQIERFGGGAGFSWLAIGGSGVDIFFVISGFIMGLQPISINDVWHFL